MYSLSIMCKTRKFKDVFALHVSVYVSVCASVLVCIGIVHCTRLTCAIALMQFTYNLEMGTVLMHQH